MAGRPRRARIAGHAAGHRADETALPQQQEELRLRVLESLAKFCAILAGVLLTGITLMTCGSLIGRNTVGVSIVGAFELTGVAAGAAIALFMPLAQVRRGNIIVDFFTARASARTNERLDRLGALLLAVIFALLAWRTTLGGLNSYSSGSETQIMGFPEWVVYATMVPAFVLAGVISLWQAALGFGGTREGEDAAI
jgi:TRAP-type C4-dicarboxylate transport system permease small subunit